MHIIFTTTKRKKDARKLAKILLQKRLVACAQTTRIKSRYVWENRLCVEREILLTLKTRKKCLKKIKRTFKKYHPYKTPEFIALRAKARGKYGAWVRENTQ